MGTRFCCQLSLIIRETPDFEPCFVSSQYFAIKNGVDCEQPLFFFRVSEESAYSARAENRVWSFVCLVRFTRRTNKKKDCSKESEE